MTIEGTEMNFTIPANLQGIQPHLVDGLTPVIINIIPVNNLHLLLGESRTKEELNLSKR